MTKKSNTEIKEAVTGEEMFEYFKGIMLFLANHGWTQVDKRAVAIGSLIKSRCQQTTEK